MTSGVVIADGEFEYAGTDAVAPNVPIEVKDGARLYLNNIVEVFNVSHPIKIAGNISYDGTGDGALKIRIVARIANLNAPITVIDDAKIKIFSANSTVNFNAPINGNGNLVFSSGGAGELHAHQIYFNAPSTFAGDVTFMNDLGASSYFHWGVDDAMPTNSVLSLGCMNYREFTMKTGIDLKGYNQRTAGISDGAKVQVRTERFITNSVANLITLTMDVGTENSLVYSAPIGGKIALVKCGEGTQMLTGDGSARSGNITVQHGGLLVDESYLLQADQVEVSHGAVLSLADAEATQNSSSQTELFAGTDKLIAGEPAKIDIAAGVEVAVWRFAKDGVYKRAGTWGSTGSGADNVDDEIFIGGGILQVLETGPASATIILVR